MLKPSHTSFRARNSPDSPVVEDLRRQVANAFLLYANYKHYHWQTYGPLFRDLHKLFDKLAKDVLPTLDESAGSLARRGGPCLSVRHGATFDHAGRWSKRPNGISSWS
jgi:DNA-binding ferritin-like protein